jgi:hypothetical protein
MHFKRKHNKKMLINVKEIEALEILKCRYIKPFKEFAIKKVDIKNKNYKMRQNETN